MLALPGLARAQSAAAGPRCVLPPGPTLYAEYAEVAVAPTIRRDIFGPARPSLVLATSQQSIAQELRSLGAYTILWQMKIERLLGDTRQPADSSSIVAAADQLYDKAVATTGCSTPSIALNELQGNWVPTPWGPTNAQYRANALELMRRLHARGAHPYLMVTTTPRPFTSSPEVVQWWRDAAAVGDLVLQVHFDGRYIYSRGPVEAGRLRRQKMRSVLDQFTAIGIPSQRLGLLHGFQSGRGFGGREGLPLAAWLRVVKWEVLAAKQVIAERAAAGAPIGSDWSWGWGDFPTLSKVDPQKHITACVYLWVRNPALCDGPGHAAKYGIYFNESLEEGQIILRPGAQCTVGHRSIWSADVARVAALRSAELGPVGSTEALALEYERLLERQHVEVPEADIATAEDAIVTERFAGDTNAYLAALAAAGVDRAEAQSIIGDQLRRERIAGALRRGRTFRKWALTGQRRALGTTTCAFDVRPALTVVDLTRWTPFLRLV